MLGCRHVNDIVVDAPLRISTEMISRLGIHQVVRFVGPMSDQEIEGETDRFQDAKEAGIVVEVALPKAFNLKDAAQKIQEEKEHFSAKFQRKMKAEREFYDAKHGAIS